MSIFLEKKTSRYSVVRLDKFCIIIAKTTFLLADSQIPAHISPLRLSRSGKISFARGSAFQTFRIRRQNLRIPSDSVAHPRQLALIRNLPHFFSRDVIEMQRGGEKRGGKP